MKIKNSDSHRYEFGLLKSTVPSMRYTGEEPIGEWKIKVREKLTELLGLPLCECPENFEIEHRREEKDYVEYRFTVETEPGYFVPCYLRIPSGVAKPVPITLCLSGHGAGMSLALGIIKRDKDRDSLSQWPHRNMAERAIREGRAALVIEARSFGESSLDGYGTSCTEAAKIALLIGRTTIGERVWDAMKVLDAVENHFKELDMSSIVCTGNSGGGTATYYLACMDERITAAAPSCSVCTYEDSIAAMPHCMCNHIPGIRKYFEMGDLAVLIAPRKLVIAAGMKDEIFPIEATKKNYETVKRIYEDSGVPENCALVIGELGHFNYADLLWEKLHEMGI